MRNDHEHLAACVDVDVERPIFRQYQAKLNLLGIWNHVNIGIKHGFSCINIRQVPWEVLKTDTSHGTWQMLMHWKSMFSCYYCIKTENICYISRYILHYFVSSFHRCLANAISTDYARSGAGHYISHDGSNSMAQIQSY